jgi:hypothetical protein
VTCLRCRRAPRLRAGLSMIATYSIRISIARHGARDKCAACDGIEERAPGVALQAGVNGNGGASRRSFEL